MKKSLNTTLKHIRRTPFQALAATAVLTVTFYVTSIFSLGIYSSHQILNYFETRPQVTAFFEDTATTEDINSLKTDLASKEFVSNVKFVSKDEALAIYREQNQDDPLLLEMVTAEILPASLEVSGINAKVLPQIAQIMSGRSGVEEVVYQKDVVESISKWTKSLRSAGIELVASLVVTSFLIIFVIIEMKIVTRKREITILSLLGASSWYIKNPFILEGLLYGTLGAILGWSFSYIRLLYATPFLVSFLGEIPLLPIPAVNMIILLAVQMTLGIVIGSFASFIAVRRFLKSK